MPYGASLSFETAFHLRLLPDVPSRERGDGSARKRPRRRPHRPFGAAPLSSRCRVPSIRASGLDFHLLSFAYAEHTSRPEATGLSADCSRNRCAPVLAIRLAPHDGQMPRRLHEKAPRMSAPHCLHRARANPHARTPHVTYLRNSCSTYRGSPSLPSSFAMARSVVKCSRTRR